MELETPIRQGTTTKIMPTLLTKGDKKTSKSPMLQIPVAMAVPVAETDSFVDVVVLRDKANRAPRKNRVVMCERCRQEKLSRKLQKQREPCKGR